MAGKKTAVFGIYHNANQAERVVDRLREEGFSNDDISVLLQDNQGSKDFAHEKNTKAPEGTTTGVTTGGVIGGTLGMKPSGMKDTSRKVAFFFRCTATRQTR